MKHNNKIKLIAKDNAFPLMVIGFLIVLAVISYHFTNLYQSSIRTVIDD